jgi:Rrf2 family transcriptional regulator, cysteine metabolism repressor
VFTISARGVYGLTAVVELAINFNSGPVQIRDIASLHTIPQHYLEQILVVLKKAGFVESFRGAQGGYALAREPRTIGIMELLTALEGRLEIVAEDKRSGSLSFFWTRLETSIAGLLEGNLEDLVQDKIRSEQSFVYTI